MTRLFVGNGDVTRTPFPVDAISTLINSQGDWFGGVDFAIKRVAGDQYHSQVDQLRLASGLSDGQVIVAKKHKDHLGNFTDVIFVVDDLLVPLNLLVNSALHQALDYKSIAFPVMRTGKALGWVEPDKVSALRQMLLGINNFIEESGTPEIDIYIIVYNDAEAVKFLSDSMKLLPGHIA